MFIETATNFKAEPRLDTKKPDLKMTENKQNKTEKIKKKPKKWRLVRKRKQQQKEINGKLKQQQKCRNEQHLHSGTTDENMKVNSAFSWS